MGLQIIDYSKIAPQGAPYRDLFESALKGYQISQEPAKMKEEQSARQLANQLRKLEVEHKPKEYALSDQGKSLANAMHAKALKNYDEKFALDKRHKEAQIAKLTQKGLNSGMKLNGAVANAEAIYQLEHDPNADPEHIEALKTAFNVGQEHTQTTTERGKTLNKTQYKRDSTPVTKAYDEIESIQKGKFPGTDRDLTPEQQTQMQSSLMMDIVKKTTDPKTREKLINANNMNITLGSIDPKKLTYYSGIEGEFVDKPADAILEGLGEGSREYKSYIEEITKAAFAAKQMRQYLADSIQPAAQDKLDKLAKPEAWNVSPQTAERNFNFMRDLYKQESQTLVRAISDPTLYQGTGADNPADNSAFTVNAPKIPSSVKSKSDFQRWLKTLTPAQRAALKAHHAGGK